MAEHSTLTRESFTTSRASEYFSVRELQAMMGQPREQFAAVVLKELADNALDAAETAGALPELTLSVCCQAIGCAILVGDNGPGLAPELVERQIDFTSRTSDKAAYRGPSRGAQGNALKTIIGLPHALNGGDPIQIESCNIRHQIRAWVDPSGEPRIEHTTEPCDRSSGTQVIVCLPEIGVDGQAWARRFALFNPHALVKIYDASDSSYRANCDAEPIVDIYQPTVAFPDEWSKWLPRDPTPPWWYDAAALERLIFLHIAAARNRGAPDLLLRDFVRQFRGLTATAKAAAICRLFPTIRHLSDFDGQRDQVDELLQAMRAASTPPKPAALGLVGEHHLRTCLDAWYGVVPGRWWYSKASLSENGIPFIVEVAVAETQREGAIYTGINFSPTFEDPLASTLLNMPEYTATGFRGALIRCQASPLDNGARTAAVLHIVSPALEFLDRGKTRLSLAPPPAGAVAEAVGRTTKVLYQDSKRRERDAARAERRDEERRRDERARDLPLNKACFLVLPAALAHATGDGRYPVSSKNLHYAIRPRIQPYTRAKLEYTYFSQEILTQYREQYGPIPGLYYDPRGVLYEPHTGHDVALGTREVDAYRFPNWLYDKILYIEKKGLWPIIKAAQFAERYDMAVIAAEGYATEAARVLFAYAEKDRHYRLFVLHDADPDGYNIARTLREATRRMPDYHVDVVDIGLQLNEALALGLGEEEFTRKKAIARDVEEALDAVERQYFIGRQVGLKAWACRRVELNALTAPQLVTLIEQKLETAGASTKVLPPAEILAEAYRTQYEAAVAGRVADAVAELVDLPTIQATLRDALRDPVLRSRPDPHTLAARILAKKREMPWRDVVTNRVDTRLDRLRDTLRNQVRAALVDTLAATDLQQSAVAEQDGAA